MKNKNYPFRYAIVLGFFSIISIYSQSISQPTFSFFQACASSSFNTYPVDFTPSRPSDFAANNIFYLQLSDASGNFSATPVEVASIDLNQSARNVLAFIVPSNFVGGESYRFRIRSSAPVVLSAPSANVPIYYQTFTNNFYINNRLATAKFCLGSNVTLTIDEPTSPPSTLKNLTYRWFRNDVLIAGENGLSLAVNLAGTYYADINYGSCSTTGSITRSQNVVVSSAPALPALVISSNTGTIIPAGNFTTLSGVQNSSLAYQWYKDGILIPSAINFDYVTNQAGTYYLIVNNGLCTVQSNSIALTLQSTTPIGAVIPNLVSPNNDGSNDTWVIPADYIAGTNTEITLTDAVGKLVLKTSSYNNDFPTAAVEFKSANPVYYYVIKTQNGESKKGSITLIK